MEMSNIVPSGDAHEARTQLTKHIAESSAPFSRPKPVCDSCKAAINGSPAPSYDEDVSPPEADDASGEEGSAVPARKVRAEASVGTFDSGRSQALSSAHTSHHTVGSSDGSRSNRSFTSFIWSNWPWWFKSSDHVPPRRGQDPSLSQLGGDAPVDYPPGPLALSNPSFRSAERPGSQSSRSSTTQTGPSSPYRCFSSTSNSRRPNEQPDLEGFPIQRTVTMEHRARITQRADWTQKQIRMRVWSPVIAVLAAIEIILVLAFSKSKAMTRGGFMGGVLVIDAAVVTWMVADSSTSKVEALMAATFIVVLGFWMTSNIDTFFGYP